MLFVRARRLSSEHVQLFLQAVIKLCILASLLFLPKSNFELLDFVLETVASALERQSRYVTPEHVHLVLLIAELCQGQAVITLFTRVSLLGSMPLLFDPIVFGLAKLRLESAFKNAWLVHFAYNMQVLGQRNQTFLNTWSHQAFWIV